jgi:class 3 adenylate cyclase/CheY-like chemotaxis protein
MHEPPRILLVDDNEANLDVAKVRLESQGYEVVTAGDGEEALVRVRETGPDLVLLDIMMPKLDGIEVTRRLKADASLPFTPIILVTAKADAKDVVAGLNAGGDDYLTKPFDHASLVARVRSMLRIKALHDTVEAQRAELKTLNANLENRVAEQVSEIERVNRLRRFLAPQLVEMIVTSGGEHVFQSHRREIVVLFCDLRGFTAFAETAEPEDVMAVLRSYHEALGPLVHRHEGTLMRFTGDGLMVFFNDPIPCPDPAARAVRLATDMRTAAATLTAEWRGRGHEIGFGIGIAQGYATLGRIGFNDQIDYTAMGTVTNLAARLCDAARDGQILVSQRVAASIGGVAILSLLGDVPLKGLTRPGAVHAVTALRDGDGQGDV